MNTYDRYQISFKRGQGAWLEDFEGNKYLDFASGIAVNILGHNHQRLNNALKERVDGLWHVSNLYKIPEQEELSKRLCNISFADKAFFCNSGAEAVEGAIKVARRYHFSKGNKKRNDIITFEGSFHGRTLGTLAASANNKHIEGFGPMPEGFVSIPFGDHELLKNNISSSTAAILVEPIQGEGGIRVIPKECLRGIRVLCDENDILMVVDEVQSGLYRTGKAFAYEWSSITPDIMALAKGLGGGFPIGAVLSTKEAAEGMISGSHGSTFGGNPLACSIANEVLKIFEDEKISENITDKSNKLVSGLEELIKRHKNKIKDVRGKGLMLGVECYIENSVVTKKSLEAGLLLVNAGENVVRIMPPLNITEEDIDEFFLRFNNALESLEN
jgi:acetylornithine/N-succinyldiaminopimelate aminotransferase